MEMWETLKRIYEGTTKIKRGRINTFDKESEIPKSFDRNLTK